MTVNTHNDEDKYYDKLPFKVDFEKKNLENIRLEISIVNANIYL